MPEIVEVSKPCYVPPPEITLRWEDVPEVAEDEVEQPVTFTPEAYKRLAHSIREWSGFTALVAIRCGTTPPRE